MTTNKIDIIQQTQTTDTTVTKVLSPDGAGGVAWAAAGSGSTGVTQSLTNKSGASVAAGDVVIIDTGNDSAFTTTTTGAYTAGTVGIAQATIANNASGSVLIEGYAALINVNASVTRGQFAKTHTVVKQATGTASRASGTFAQFLTGGTTPIGILWGAIDLVTTPSVIDGGAP